MYHFSKFPPPQRGTMSRHPVQPCTTSGKPNLLTSSGLVDPVLQLNHDAAGRQPPKLQQRARRGEAPRAPSHPKPPRDIASMSACTARRQCIEELRSKREELNKTIASDEEEKGRIALQLASARVRGWCGRTCLSRCQCTCVATAKIQNDLRILTERLSRINDGLARKISSRNEYDKTIQETEGAYAKARPPRAACTCRRHARARVRAFPAPSRPPRVRADHGELADAAARAEARERQPHQEDAALVVMTWQGLGTRAWGGLTATPGLSSSLPLLSPHMYGWHAHVLYFRTC